MKMMSVGATTTIEDKIKRWTVANLVWSVRVLLVTAGPFRLTDPVVVWRFYVVETAF
jgi:hypothetical protein